MRDEQAFLQAMQANPEDNALRLVFADWLEERGDARGELIRLLHTLTQRVEVPDRNKLEDRLRSLLASGVQPVGPFWTNSIGMKFAWVPAGTFLMGSSADEGPKFNDETQHQVTLTRGFYLAIYPVTQTSWQKVAEHNPSHFQGNHLPVETVSWHDCQEFLETLSERDGHSYRLPTEAEWEYACRAGTTTAYHFGTTISREQAHFLAEHTSVVGSFPANAWGLYDMHGNVWEWCADLSGLYPTGEVLDPQGAKDGVYGIMRGGSYVVSASLLRSAIRSEVVWPCREQYNGFRPVRTFP